MNKPIKQSSLNLLHPATLALVRVYHQILSQYHVFVVIEIMLFRLQTRRYVFLVLYTLDNVVN